MDALFGVAPYNEAALERGELGSVKNICNSVDKADEIEQVGKDY